MTGAAGYMARALVLAARGIYTTHPNPRVGCVIVRDGVTIGEGWHRRAGEPHAEVHALSEAGERARGADVFVTLEPCAHFGRTPPCADALIAAGVAKVWIAMQDPFPQVVGRGISKLRAAGIEVELGLLESEAQELNRGFVSRITRGRPFVTLKLAMSLDGRTAMASGESRWITGAAAREDVHRLRAAAGAVLTSSATVLADDPELSARIPKSEQGKWRQPDRIVLDTHARVPSTAKVWAEGARRFWLTAPSQSRHSREGGNDSPGVNRRVSRALHSPVRRMDAPNNPVLADKENIGIERFDLEPDANGAVPLAAALTTLATHDISEIIVECGPRLAGGLLQAGLVDELVIYTAPKLLGDAARPLAELPGLRQLADHIALRFDSVEIIGDDLKIIARVAEKRT